MSLESATWATQLSPTDPQSSDPRSQGDDHLRLIKTVIQTELSSSNRQWVYTGDSITRISNTVFTATGDQSDVWEAGRRVKITGSPSTGTIYGDVKSSTYSSTTAVTLGFDSGALAANDTFETYVSLLTSGNTAIPASGGNDLISFGGVGDGTTDNTTALTNALAATAGQTLTIPEGTFALDIDTDNQFTLPLNTTIRGEGPSSVLRLNMTDTGTYGVFQISSNGVRFENLKIEINTSVTGGTLVLFSLERGIRFENVEIDGNVTADSASSHICQILKCTNTDNWSNLFLEECYWHDMTRCFLRENAATSTINGLSISNCRFENSEASMWAFNAPNGRINDVSFVGNQFLNPFINAVQSDSFCIGPQVNNCTITGNTFRGTGQECIHIEENADNIAITGNTIDMNCATNAISVTDNNISGSDVSPQRVIIDGNTIRRTNEDGATGDGIDLVNDATGFPPVTGVIVTNNIIKGWGRGLVNGNHQSDLNVFTGNVIDGCGTGFASTYGAPGFRDNLLANNTTGITTITAGGAFGRNRYYNNTTQATGTNGSILLNDGFEVIWARTLVANATATNFTTGFPVGSTNRAFGRLMASAVFSDALEQYVALDVSATAGGVASAHSIINSGDGTMTITATAVSSELQLRITHSDGTDRTVGLSCHFDGPYFIT